MKEISGDDCFRVFDDDNLVLFYFPDCRQIVNL